MTGDSAGFTSILWSDPESRKTAPPDPETLRDLALERIMQELPAGPAREAWAVPLLDPGEVTDRQDVFDALAAPAVRAAVDRFLADWTQLYDAMHETQRARFPAQKQLWQLRAVLLHARTVTRFREALPPALADVPGRSRLLDRLVEHLAQLGDSDTLRSAAEQGADLQQRIAAIRADLLIQGGKVAVADYDDEPDLASAVLATFKRFRQGAVSDYLVDFRETTDLDHVQGAILDLIVEHNQDVFRELGEYVARTDRFVDSALDRLVAELPFYLRYLDLIRPLIKAGLTVCRPTLTNGPDRLNAERTWDLALAATLSGTGAEVVTNELVLAGAERILVISGPNQGGKTTTARIFGQLHYLAALGCPVPGSIVELRLPDRVATLFEREERLESLEGRLGTEIDRIHDLLDTATERTVVVLNEAFSSTTLADARVLTREVLHRIERLDAAAVCVTFIDELSRLDEHTVSMTSTVDPDDLSLRTYKVERRRADGRAYVEALAARHRLTRSAITDRIRSEVPA